MNHHELKLKQIIHEAALDAGQPLRRIRDDVEDLLSSLGDDDDALEVAAKALYRLCIEDGRFNRFVVGLKAVLRFLAETIPVDQQPNSDHAVVALGAVMKSGCTLAKLRRWSREWYG